MFKDRIPLVTCAVLEANQIKILIKGDFNNKNHRTCEVLESLGCVYLGKVTKHGEDLITH